MIISVNLIIYDDGFFFHWGFCLLRVLSTGFCPLGVLFAGGFIHWGFCSLRVLSTGGFVRWWFCPLGVLFVGDFVHWGFCSLGFRPLGVLFAGGFVSWEFCSLGFLSTAVFVHGVFVRWRFFPEPHLHTLLSPTTFAYLHLCNHTTRRQIKWSDTQYYCHECDEAVCIEPCFEEYHTLLHF